MRVTARLSDSQPACRKPRPRGDILRIAELRCADPLATEISWFGKLFVRLNDERRPSVHCAGDDADFPPSRAGVCVDRRVRPDISEIDAFRKDRLHRAGAGIIGIPIDVDIGAKPIGEPIATMPLEVPGNQRLSVRYIREMTDRIVKS